MDFSFQSRNLMSMFFRHYVSEMRSPRTQSLPNRCSGLSEKNVNKESVATHGWLFLKLECACVYTFKDVLTDLKGRVTEGKTEVFSLLFHFLNGINRHEWAVLCSGLPHG